jgi:hypothetical protein
MAAEIAVEQKRADVRKVQMATEIAVEQQRSQLINSRVENERKDADSRVYTLTETLKPLRDLNWKTLMALGGKGADPKAMIAIAFQEWQRTRRKSVN